MVKAFFAFSMNSIIGVNERKQFTGIDGEGRAANDQWCACGIADNVNNHLVTIDETLLAVKIHIIDIPQGETDIIRLKFLQGNTERFRRVEVEIEDSDLVMGESLAQVRNKVRNTQRVNRIWVSIPVC